MPNYSSDKDEINSRIKVVLIVIVLLNLLLIAKLYVIQIKDADKYRMLSERNSVHLSPIFPKRGCIITSDGKVVANSPRKHKLIMDKYENFLQKIDFLKNFVSFSEADNERIVDSRKRKLPIISLKEELSWDEYAKISMTLFKLDGISIENTYTRSYAIPLEMSHIIGYVSKDSKQFLIGKTGIETVFNDHLTGKIGNIQEEMNAAGKKIRIINSQKPEDGEDICISIDSQLQSYIYNLLLSEKAGACVVLDISNGEVIAMVSVPSFDINIFSNKMTKKQWEDIGNNRLFPLLNRAINCSYPPGSIFKIIVAFAALSEGIISPKDRVFCAGKLKQDNHTFHCWNRSGHGWMNLQEAIKFSCDCYFFELAKKVGIDNIVKYAKKFGFGVKSGIELTNENPGLLPTKRWKFLRYGSTWKPYETTIVGIGQGALLATLIQIANMMGKLYNEDYNFSSTLIKSARKNLASDPIDSTHAKIIKEALHQVCVSGTAAGSCNTDYGISGKTGSSQVRTIKANEAGMNQKFLPWELRDHAFFAACAPYKCPRYVVAILVEHGGGGAMIAAPIVRKIFDKIFEKNKL
ncbi:MAG: penicillin-binding protein 2 [Holosporaceae bacterium]|jgi:penicillin-binding protein 2|nr:penicillin-binding protein 2 [Holosporaceae bacterium]